MRKSRFALAAAVGLAVAAFWTVKTENYEFLHLDDPDFVLSNKMVKSGLSPKGLAWCFTSILEDQYWHPLTWASLMADASISSGTTESMSRVMHRHNALLQGLSAAILLLLLLRLMTAPLRKDDVALRQCRVHGGSVYPQDRQQQDCYQDRCGGHRYQRKYGAS